MFCYRLVAIRNSLVGKSPGLSIGIVVMLLLWGCQAAGPAARQNPSQLSDKVVFEQNQARIREELGIEVVAIRRTAAGSMLDFRFKVLDKEKSMPFFKREIKPHLIDQKTGAALEVPVPAKGGPMRPTSRDPREGVTYFMLFANPGRFVKPGNPVTIVIGDIRIENLIVE
jgi:hypothetical protein